MDTFTVDREPSCTQEGSASIRCGLCGAVKESKVIPARGHRDGPIVRENEIEASCTHEGSYTESLYCQDCGVCMARHVVKTNSIGHAFSDWVTRDTTVCTGTVQERVCAKCGLIESKNVSGADHKPAAAYVVDQAPTCTQDGSSSLRCTKCDAVLASKVLKATGHNPFETAQKEATCTDTGYTGDIVCSVCGITLSTGHQTPVTAHAYDNGVCVNCNAPDPTFSAASVGASVQDPAQQPEKTDLHFGSMHRFLSQAFAVLAMLVLLGAAIVMVVLIVKRRR